MDKNEIKELQEIALDRRDRSIGQGNLLSCGPYLAEYCSRNQAEIPNSKTNNNIDRYYLQGF